MAVPGSGTCRGSARQLLAPPAEQIKTGGTKALEDLLLKAYRPVSCLSVASHQVPVPRYPVIDMHNHSQWGGSWQTTDVPRLVAQMDEAGVAVMIDLDGGTGERLAEHLRRFREPYPDRFVVFSTCRWDLHLEGPDFGERLATDLREAVHDGAEGLKVWKDLGLKFRDAAGHRLAVNDRRLAPLWHEAAALGIPIVIHTGDPVAFFRPFDARNERYEELSQHPDWHFYGPEFPSFDQLADEFESLIADNPSTTFVGAHVGGHAENLGRVGRLLSTYPNFYVDISARIAELGRQPYTARRFFIQHPGKIVFGLDQWPATAGDYRVVYRFLETEDEYFDYAVDGEAHPGSQGRWKIYGIALPEPVLESVYYRTALKVLPQLKRRIGARLLKDAEDPERGPSR